jgi:hypothetical protein
MQPQFSLFNTVPSALPMLWNDEGRVQVEEVRKLLDLSKSDFARAAQASQKQIADTLKIPKEVEERVLVWALVLEEVARFFGGDARKTVLWFNIPNPLLGEVSPRDMILYGRARKLLQIVRDEIAGEVP